MEDGSSWIARLLTWFMIAVAAIVALQLAGWIAGTVLGIVMFLVFKILPLVVIGWLVVKFFRIFRSDDEFGRA